MGTGAALKQITPDAIPTVFVAFQIIAPTEWFPYLIGALSLLTKEEAWENTAGGLTPEETAQFFEGLLSIWVAAAECA